MSVARSAELESVLAAIRACRHCIEAPRGKPLPHEPRPVLRASPTARLAVCSQAPGTKVHASGTPFTDRSGDRLREWMGVTRDEFYDETRLAIVPMGFCFPGQDANGGDLPPRRECAPRWHARCSPRCRSSSWCWRSAPTRKRGISAPRQRRRLQDTCSTGGGICKRRRRPRVLPLPHPSWRNNGWLTDNPWFETEFAAVAAPRGPQLISARIPLAAIGRIIY